MVVALVAGLTSPAQGQPIGTTIRYTEHGIPHIIASNHLGLGYGYGYASAKDNLCVLADTYLTVAGRRSRFFGQDGPANSGVGSASNNLNSDLHFQRINGSGVVDRYARSASRPVRDLVRGYVNGYNRYLAQTKQTCDGTGPSDRGTGRLPARLRDHPRLRQRRDDRRTGQRPATRRHDRSSADQGRRAGRAVQAGLQPGQQRHRGRFGGRDQRWQRAARQPALPVAGGAPVLADPARRSPAGSTSPARACSASRSSLSATTRTSRGATRCPRR